MKLAVAIVLLFILPLAAFAADYRGHCSIDFLATSTLHDVHGQGRCQPFTASETDGVVSLPALSVAVASLDTGNNRRDRQMRDMFKAEKFPLIWGRTGQVVLADLRRALPEENGTPDRIVIKLKIRDIEKPVTATIRNFMETDTSIVAEAFFYLSLADYQLQPPSVLGFIRVGDRVRVTATFTLEAQ